MRHQLRAGIAIYNAGEYHAAHDAWEPYWLELESGTEDERLLHGLIQFTAAVYHARERNWVGAIGLAESAGEYLSAVPGTYRGVELQRPNRYLRALAADPELIERRRPIELVYDSDRPRPVDLSPAELEICAPILAAEWGYDAETVERASTYATADLKQGRDDSRFISLVYDFVRETAHRELIYRRLRTHVEQRTAKETDLEGLF